MRKLCVRNSAFSTFSICFSAFAVLMAWRVWIFRVRVHLAVYAATDAAAYSQYVVYFLLYIFLLSFFSALVGVVDMKRKRQNNFEWIRFGEKKKSLKIIMQLWLIWYCLRTQTAFIRRKQCAVCWCGRDVSRSVFFLSFFFIRFILLLCAIRIVCGFSPRTFMCADFNLFLLKCTNYLLRSFFTHQRIPYCVLVVVCVRARAACLWLCECSTGAHTIIRLIRINSFVERIDPTIHSDVGVEFSQVSSIK